MSQAKTPREPRKRVMMVTNLVTLGTRLSSLKTSLCYWNPRLSWPCCDGSQSNVELRVMLFLLLNGNPSTRLHIQVYIIVCFTHNANRGIHHMRHSVNSRRRHYYSWNILLPHLSNFCTDLWWRGSKLTSQQIHITQIVYSFNQHRTCQPVY